MYELVCSGVSNSNLLVFSENGPLVRPTRILEVPVHRIIMHLLSDWVAHSAGFILPGFLHQLPDAQLLDLRSEDKEIPWVGSVGERPSTQRSASKQYDSPVFAIHHIARLCYPGHGVPTPEDSSLAQPLDEDALFVAVQKDTPFQVPKELSGNLPLALVGYQLCRWELHVFQAILAIGRLSQGDPAAFGPRGGCAPHQLPSIVEVDHHLGVGYKVTQGRNHQQTIHCISCSTKGAYLEDENSSSLANSDISPMSGRKATLETFQMAMPRDESSSNFSASGGNPKAGRTNPNQAKMATARSKGKAGSKKSREDVQGPECPETREKGDSLGCEEPWIWKPIICPPEDPTSYQTGKTCPPSSREVFLSPPPADLLHIWTAPAAVK
ncbi:hypothetical protein E2320_001278 [Naja naja]|nr:hypothetical protein E2320_001278 [Naja naja]